MTPSDPQLESDVLAVLKRVSRHPVDPTMASDLVRDLGLDSMMRLELLADLEDQFDIVIPLNETPAIRTAADVAAHIRALIERQARHR